MRKPLLRLLGLGALGAALYAAWRSWSAKTKAATGPTEWDNAPFPFPPVPRPAAPAGPHEHHLQVPPEVVPGGGPETEESGFVAPESLAPWVEPVDGACPPSHPVKAKLASGIYHVPGGMNYERTHPDRCYADTAAAERDGLRPSKL
jgi:hypothetical protein